MRKAISTVLALGLIVFGLWWLWGLEMYPPPVVKVFHILVGAFPIFVGGVWLASDWWFDR
jgi:hypothetical protein